MTTILFICIAVQAALLWLGCRKYFELLEKFAELDIDNDFLRAVISEYERDARPTETLKGYPPYMSYPRKSSVNVCAGCVHEATNKGSFPCDECKRKLRGEHDMFVKKVEE